MRALWIIAMTGCSLGLDPSKIGADASMQDVGASQDGGAADGDLPPNPTQCKVDGDCKPASACLTGKCDTARGVCLYEVCPQQGACKVAACDPMALTCGPAQDIKFHVGQFKVGNIGCGGSARRCLAAVHPFVFVGTTSGAIAYAIATPNQAPSAIPIGGVPFLPVHVVASGTRVYFVGAVAGSAPSYRVPIAWLDVPGDPTVKKITAQTAFMSLPTPSIDRVYATDDGGVYLVQENAMQAFPTAKALAPLADLGDLMFFPSPGVPTGSSTASASGGRMLFLRLSTMSQPYQVFFDYETQAGTSGAQNAGESNFTMAAGNDVTHPFVFAQGASGQIVWHAAVAEWQMSMTGAYVKGTRVFWLVANASAQPDPSPRTNVESYDSMLGLGLGSDVVGPLAVIDPDRVLTLDASAQNTSNTAVRVASKAPMPQVLPNKSFVLPFAPSALAAAATGRWSYVLTPEPTMGAGPQVHVFAPDCDN
jgi:hypothetical protein